MLTCNSRTRSIVINALTVSDTQEMTVAYFYCQYDNPRKRDPHIVLGTLLCEVIEQLPAGSPLVPGILHPEILPTEELLKELISLSRGLETPLAVVVDALDECDAENRRALIIALKRLSLHAKVLVTSRDQNDIQQLLKDAPVI